MSHSLQWTPASTYRFDSINNINSQRVQSLIFELFGDVYGRESKGTEHNMEQGSEDTRYTDLKKKSSFITLTNSDSVTGADVYQAFQKK